jgi:hypothetical protein
MSAATEQSEFKSAFLDDDFFSEGVTYTPFGAASRVVRAIVHRRRPAARGQRNDGAAGSSQIIYDVEIEISRNATDGVATITPKSDTVVLPLNLGEAVSTFRVSAIVAQDAAAWKLGLSI